MSLKSSSLRHVTPFRVSCFSKFIYSWQTFRFHCPLGYTEVYKNKKETKPTNWSLIRSVLLQTSIMLSVRFDGNWRPFSVWRTLCFWATESGCEMSLTWTSTSWSYKRQHMNIINKLFGRPTVPVHTAVRRACWCSFYCRTWQTMQNSNRNFKHYGLPKFDIRWWRRHQRTILCRLLEKESKICDIRQVASRSIFV